MKCFLQRMVGIVWAEEGPTAVEYAFMLALIIVVCLVAIQGISVYPKTQFNTVSNSLSGS